MEWNPKLVKQRGSDPKLFLEMFENNGYKISIKNFFINDNTSVEELIKVKQINIFLTYQKILKL